MEKWLCCAWVLCVVGICGGAAAAETQTKSLFDYNVKSLEGKDEALAQYRGKVVLVVNTASLCGFTHQYKDLETLYKKYRDRGFVILGFPSNDFANQEPGSSKAIRDFCTTNFGVTFPLMARDHVLGKEKQPVYRFLTEESGEKFSGEIGWNFEKFLLDRSGQVRARYSSFSTPLCGQLTDELEQLLVEAVPASPLEGKK